MKILLHSIGKMVLLFAFVIVLAVTIGNGLPGHLVAAEADFEIFVIDVDRSLAVNVSPPVSQFISERDPTWSPKEEPLYGYPVWSQDGKQLAFHKWYVGQNSGDIVVLDVFTGDTQRFTASANYRDMLSWGPSDERLAYIFMDSPDPKERYNVALLNVDSGQRTVLTHIGQVVNPIWAPDGEWIAFRTLGRVSVVHPYVATNPGEGYPVTERGGHQSITWSPDGSKLSLLSYSGSHDSNFGSRITVVEPGMAQDELTCAGVNPELYAVWSPDWHFLATHTGTRGFTVLDMDTCGVMFTNGRNSGVPPLWVTNKHVVFASTNTLLAANVLSGSIKQISLPGSVHHLANRQS